MIRGRRFLRCGRAAARPRPVRDQARASRWRRLAAHPACRCRPFSSLRLCRSFFQFGQGRLSGRRHGRRGLLCLRFFWMVFLTWCSLVLGMVGDGRIESAVRARIIAYFRQPERWVSGCLRPLQNPHLGHIFSPCASLTLDDIPILSSRFAMLWLWNTPKSEVLQRSLLCA